MCSKGVRLALPSISVLMVVALAACDDSSVATAPLGSELGLSIAPGDGQAQAELFEVCKFGTAANFEVVITPGSGGPPTAFGLSLADGECQNVHLNGTLGVTDKVTVTEIIPAGFQLDKIEKTTVDGGVTTTVDIFGTNTVSGDVDGDTGVLVKFFNSPVEGGEGCTLGFWKQEQHFDSWPAPYTPSTLFSSVFENAFPGKTLLQVLQLGGGGLNALGRQTVAALLNAASSGVSFDLTVTEVINVFNAAFPSGNIEGTKNTVELFNQQGCPLN
jgi:hypothetical protein